MTVAKTWAAAGSAATMLVGGLVLGAPAAVAAPGDAACLQATNQLDAALAGAGLTPESMVKAWLDSPSHRTILLNTRARRAGVSVAQDAQGRLVGVLNVVRAD